MVGWIGGLFEVGGCKYWFDEGEGIGIVIVGSMSCGGYMMCVDYVIMNPRMYASRRIVENVSAPEGRATCLL
jgi:hypothetical protein